MDEDDKYSLHCEASDRITKTGKHSVAAQMKNVLELGNPVDLEQPKGIINIATGAILEKDKENFLMNCNSIGNAARNEFYKSRMKKKNMQLLETIPKTKQARRKKVTKNMIWLKKQLDFYVRLTMLACEISISKFLWATKSHPHAFILQKEVWSESQISLNWRLNLKVW